MWDQYCAKRSYPSYLAQTMPDHRILPPPFCIRGAVLVSRACLALAVALATGCASEIQRHATVLSAVSSPSASPTIEIAEDAMIEIHTGYHRVIPAGSVWEVTGRLSQGLAYKRRNGVFTLEGAHIHEAQIVLEDRHLVGFYLPVEQAFSPSKRIPLKTRNIPRE